MKGMFVKSVCRNMVYCLLGLLWLALGSGLFARDLTSLQAEFWLDFQPMGKDAPMAAPRKEEAINNLLEEARMVFSAMIYGYDFSYRPSDLTRQATESFVMTISGEIPKGDPDMEFREVRHDDSSLYLRVRYLTKSFEISRLEAWSNTHNLDAGGSGKASYFLGLKGKSLAFEDGCKEAIRAYARSLVLNKPAMIDGHFILLAPPRLQVISGQYVATCRLKLQITTMEAYKTY